MTRTDKERSNTPNKALADMLRASYYDDHDPLRREGADRIEQLESELAVMTGERDRYLKGMANWKATAEEKDRIATPSASASMVAVPRETLVKWEGWARVRGVELDSYIYPDGQIPSFISDGLADAMKAALDAPVSPEPEGTSISDNDRRWRTLEHGCQWVSFTETNGETHSFDPRNVSTGFQGDLQSMRAFADEIHERQMKVLRDGIKQQSGPSR